MRRFFGGLAMLLALTPLATIAGPATSTAAPTTPTVTGSDFNTFNAVTFNAVDAAGVEVPYVGGQQTFEVAFDTSGYTIQPGESGSSPNYNGCIGSPTVYAGRTAWVRFTPGVSGKLFAQAITSSYNSVLIVHRGARTALGGTDQFSILQGSLDCSNANEPQAGNEGIGNVVLDTSHTYWLQVGGRCASTPATCDETMYDVPGGPTILRMTFVPDDRDGDGVANTVDVCPDVVGQATAQGCPDGDGDGIRDDNGADSCPTLPGVPAAAPYNGCPDGPTPPDPGNPPYVTIVSLTGDLDTSSNTAVRLSLNWPQGAQTMRLSNGDGLFTAPVRIESGSVDWLLRPLTDNQSSASREVEVIFQGPGIPDNAQDDSITLDTVAPEAPKRVFARNGSAWHFFVKGTDSGTGVRKIEMLDRQAKVLRSRTFCSKNCSEVRRVGLFSASKKPWSARITDAAGNAVTVRLRQQRTDCQDAPPYLVWRSDSIRNRCWTLKEDCRFKGWEWEAPGSLVTCKRSHVRLR